MTKQLLRNVTKGFLFLVLAVVFCTGGFVATASAQVGTKAEAPKNPLLGRWKSDEAVVEFRADGSIKINDDELKYKVKGSVITLITDEGAMAVPFELDGDTMVAVFQGREIVYKRLKANATTGQSGMTGAATGAGERVIPEFVGKWCYLSNLGGTSSYRSDKCFALYQNGTYEFSGETSSSGAAGSSVGATYDTGRWTASRTTLTVYSQKYGKIVYPIQLRNHPKNNDPMIVVDGDSYVTQTQRRPW